MSKIFIFHEFPEIWLNLLKKSHPILSLVRPIEWKLLSAKPGWTPCRDSALLPASGAHPASGPEAVVAEW